MLLDIGSIFKALEIFKLLVFLSLSGLVGGIFLLVASKDEILYLLASALLESIQLFNLRIGLVGVYLGGVLNELVRKVKVDVGYLFPLDSPLGALNFSAAL